MGLTRFAVDLGFVHRPLFAAGLWALVTWQTQPAISVGIFFELLWLDLFPAGTFIPPHGVLALAAALTLLACLPDPDTRLIVLVLVCTMPLGYLGAWAEQRYRRRQNLSYNALIAWNRHRASLRPEALTRLALAETLALKFGMFLLCLLPMLPALRMVRPWIESGPQPSWPMLWAAACLGGILSLRIRKAYVLAGLTVAVGVMSAL